ncbi:hypothetical protein [Bacillus paranthracis]|uniref:hypothetical protein n=1 Tax=Bacillus paranthracis TaxID=2026186 RepID=UPI002E1EA9A9|nr:hypothetical protein [Bacillus paranthracis]MED1683534.1 hypothetical protein [Bacillus paranthracis]
MRPDMRRRCCDNRGIKCECSGIVNSNSMPGVHIVADICPNCEDKDSSVFVNIVNYTFTSKSVWLPLCVTRDNGLTRRLLVTGEGLFTMNGVVREGLFTLLLTEKPGLYDNLFFIFFDFARPSDPAAAANLLIPGEELSVESCKTNNCMNKNVTSISSNILPEFDDPDESKLTIFHTDGNIEVIKL